MAYSIKIEGQKVLESDWPNALKDGLPIFTRDVGEQMADAIKQASPKGAIPFTSTPASDIAVKITSNHPGAKALDKGAYIAPKGHPRLRFSVGGRTVFPRFVRLKARNYVRKGLRARNKIATEEFLRWMAKLD